MQLRNFRGSTKVLYVVSQHTHTHHVRARKPIEEIQGKLFLLHRSEDKMINENKKNKQTLTAPTGINADLLNADLVNAQPKIQNADSRARARMDRADLKTKNKIIIEGFRAHSNENAHLDRVWGRLTIVPRSMQACMASERISPGGGGGGGVLTGRQRIMGKMYTPVSSTG